ncbi:hypothetical protein [Lysinibacillus sp. FSL W8-0992]|uniref:hypothetical protein n=1 Tax=Lysinibacillus sp. FSL W8-0992 TaxID=2954643 RepID=UPI0030FA3D42
MSINKIIRDALLPLGVPVMYMTYTGTATTYITFFRYNERGALQADDKEQLTRHSVQVDIWGKEDIEALTESVKDQLQAIGFVRNSYFEDFEKETKTYHKAYRFYYDI